MRILVFSDIHGDLAALNRLLDIEADLYFAAGDLVSWGRGLDAVGQTLTRRRDQVHVLPGNHETESMIEELCERYGLDAFHGKIIEADGYSIGGLGYSSITPFKTPGEYTEEEIKMKRMTIVFLFVLAIVCPFIFPNEKVSSHEKDHI